MMRLKLWLAAILLSLAVVAVLTSVSFAQGEDTTDQVVVYLRGDQANVNNAQNYALWIDPATP